MLLGTPTSKAIDNSRGCWETGLRSSPKGCQFVDSKRIASRLKAMHRPRGGWFDHPLSARYHGIAYEDVCCPDLGYGRGFTRAWVDTATDLAALGCAARRAAAELIIPEVANNHEKGYVGHTGEATCC